MHAHRELITDVLKGKLRFGGFVISDWEDINQIPGDRATQIRTGINAGIDMMMEPSAYQTFIPTLIDEVHADRVPMSRIDDAVSRILTKKFQLGLFEHPFTNRSEIGKIGSAEHRAVARRAVAKSQVLLKNKRSTLPLRRHDDVYVAGSNADNIGNQAGGWTLTWQGGSRRTSSPARRSSRGIREAAGRGTDVTYSADASAPIRRSDVGVVVVGETPYYEGFGDVGGPLWACDPGDNGVPRPVKDMQLSSADKAAVDKVWAAARKCAVVIVSGRPLIIDPAQLGRIDALVAAWLPGSEGAGAADTLRTLAQEPINVGDASCDPLYPFGFGLMTR